MSIDQASFGMAYDPESEIEDVFDERFEEYTEKAVAFRSLNYTLSCLCTLGC